MSALVPLLLLCAAAPARVVSMAPCLTDDVLALGLRGTLVGVSRFDDEPELSALPRVGGYLDPNVEAIVRLRPDLVLALDGEAERGTIAALRRSGLTVEAFRSDTLPEILGDVVEVAAALGDRPRGERLRAELERGLHALPVAQKARRAVIAVGYRPLVVAGRGSYLEPLLAAAGLANAVASPLAWPTASVEAFVAHPPDVWIDGGPEDDPGAARLFALLRAQGTRVVRLPDADLFRASPRALRAVRELSAALR
ncbi:MAG: ABC transporter substrate-binding protein [Deltaproteobacteria bacterium]